jgi:hypothetical protein
VAGERKKSADKGKERGGAPGQSLYTLLAFQKGRPRYIKRFNAS